MKRGIVYYRDIPAGELIKDGEGFLSRNASRVHFWGICIIPRWISR